MEKGKVRNMSGHNSGGTIADGQGRAINFDNSNIVGKDRSSLKTGDFVWFERVGANVNVKAINVRLC